MNVLELARKTKARVFHTSTSEIYGDPEVYPQPESYWGNVNTVGTRSCYDEGKHVEETFSTDVTAQAKSPIRRAAALIFPRLTPY